MVIFLVVLGALCVAATPLVAQETDDAREQGDATREEVFAPFVSRLRLSIRDPRVRVSWVDADDLLATYRVYRSSEPITNESFDQARLVARVATGEEGYVDLPPEPGTYYYAVVAENATGTPYRVVIPGRNASYIPVEIASTATQEQRAARVSGIDAAVVATDGQSAIEITVLADREGRSLAVYRSTERLESEADLADATLVREVPSGETRVVDLPVPGVPYYYAAVDAELLVADGVTITPGRNATLEAAEIPLATALARAGEQRPDTDAVAQAPSATAPGRADAATDDLPVFEPDVRTAEGVPLPFLQLQSQLATGQRLRDPRILIPNEQPLEPTTESAVAAVLERLGPRADPQLEPTILPEDTMPEPEGADYTLRTILEGPFARMAWESALGQLENFFTLPLPPELEARAHFYRGQVYYFLGERQRAVLELLARDRYFAPVEA